MESSKWHGSVQVPMAAPLQHVWEIASNFCAVEKWFPGIQVCQRVEGTPEQGVGCVRFVSLTSPAGTSWAKEKLTSLDTTTHSYAYAIIDTNMEGFHGYEATLQVSEGEDEGTCLVIWNFQFNPVAGHSEHEFVGNWISVCTLGLNGLCDVAAAS